jgi:hypothetical protein
LFLVEPAEVVFLLELSDAFFVVLAVFVFASDFSEVELSLFVLSEESLLASPEVPADLEA